MTSAFVFVAIGAILLLSWSITWGAFILSKLSYTTGLLRVMLRVHIWAGWAALGVAAFLARPF